MTKEPVKGFRAVSLQQVINADREMWMLAAQEARGKSLMDPAKPWDSILELSFKAPETTYHLLPMPQSGGVKETSSQHPEKTTGAMGL